MIFEYKNNDTKKKHQIEVYDSVQNLPIKRFQKFNKYQMIAAEIGNSFSDYDARTAKTLEFLKKDMVKEAIQELENRRQTVFNAMNEFTPFGRSFAVLIKRIDEVNYIGYTPDDLDRILIHLEEIGFDVETAVDKLVEVKKKIDLELTVYFPRFFKKSGFDENTALRVSVLNMQCDEIIYKRDFTENIFTVEKEMLENSKPNIWNVHREGNMERTLEVDFEKYATSIKEHIDLDIETTTTFTFYATVEHLIEKLTPNED